jgi:mono/diheme cytochrome c family protein
MRPGFSLLLFSGTLLLMLLTACEQISPEARRLALHLPPPGYKGVAAEGVVHYTKFCQVCHGVNGMGTHQAPPLVNEVYRPGHHADLSFHVAVRDGVPSHHWSFGDMSPVPLITPEETEHIIAYIRNEQRSRGIH